MLGWSWSSSKTMEKWLSSQYMVLASSEGWEILFPAKFKFFIRRLLESGWMLLIASKSWLVKQAHQGLPLEIFCEWSFYKWCYVVLFKWSNTYSGFLTSFCLTQWIGSNGIWLLPDLLLCVFLFLVAGFEVSIWYKEKRKIGRKVPLCVCFYFPILCLPLVFFSHN